MKKTKHPNGGGGRAAGGDPNKQSRTKTVAMNESGGNQGRYDSESENDDDGEKDDIILDTSVHTRNMQ